MDDTDGGRGSKGANWQGELSPFALPNISEENDEKGDVPRSYRNSKIGIVPKYGKVWSCYISRRTNIAILVVVMFLLMAITSAITYYIATVHCECKQNEVSTKAPPKDKGCVSKTRQFAIEGVQYFALGEGEARKILNNTSTQTVSDLQVQLTLE